MRSLLFKLPLRFPAEPFLLPSQRKAGDWSLWSVTEDAALSALPTQHRDFPERASLQLAMFRQATTTGWWRKTRDLPPKGQLCCDPDQQRGQGTGQWAVPSPCCAAQISCSCESSDGLLERGNCIAETSIQVSFLCP